MPRSTTEFAENSLLDILIPEASKLDIEEVLKKSDHPNETDEAALITSVPERSVLFFDEPLTIYIVLQTPYQEEQTLKSYVSRLDIALEAHAISSNPGHPATGESQPKDVIWSGTIDVAEDPVLVVEESEEDDEARSVFIIWKSAVTLNRPRIRLHAPAILFKLSANIRPFPIFKQNDLVDPLMPNGVSLPANLLQSLKDDPALNGIEPRLSALRLSRTVPVLRPPKSQVCPLKVVPRRAFRAIPALSARVRYSKSINLSSKPALIASLDIEIPSFIQYTVEIKSIKLRLPNGEAEDVTSRNGLKLPIKCRSRDNVIFLYRLLAGVSLTDGVIAASNAKMLEISISAAVLVSDNCLPRIEMRWSTGVDFSTALNPNFGAPGQSMQRGNRPTSLPSVNPLNSNALLATRDEKRALDSEVAPEQAMSSLSDLGLTVTITDIGKVYVGEPFRWEVLIVNRSTRPQKLAIVVTPKRKKEDIKRHVSRHSGSLSHDGKKDTVSGAIVDENYLHAMQKMDALEDAYLVCLTTDIRIGPLNPGSCYSTELKFLPLAKGYLQVDSVRIIDISSTETVEVRDLPDIIAIERPRED